MPDPRVPLPGLDRRALARRSPHVAALCRLVDSGFRVDLEPGDDSRVERRLDRLETNERRRRRAPFLR